MAVLCQHLAEGTAGVVLIQGLLIYRGQMRNITNSGVTMFSFALVGNVRSCIHVRNNINTLPLLEFCYSDATTVRMTYIMLTK
jgi:hypothetical protein